MSKDRIAILIINLASGGAERLLVNTIPQYVEHNIPIKLYLLNGSNNKSEYVSALENAIEVESLSNLKPNCPLNIFKLRKVLKAESIVHVHLFPTNLWLVLAKIIFRSKVTLVNTEHGIVNKSFMKKPMVKRLVRFIYKRFDYHIAISKEIAGKIAQLIKREDHIEQINNGVDVQRVFEADSILKSEICKELQILPESKLLLMTARFHEQKNQKLIIDALEQLDINIHLLFLGEGKLQAETEQYAITQNMKERVHFLGFRANAVNYMKSVDINILSSHYEGLSGAVVEAMASGKPFIGSNVPGINDVVEDDRYLFSSKGELAKRIREILSNQDPAERMSQDSLLYVKNYEMQLMVDKHVSFYRKLLSAD